MKKFFSAFILLTLCGIFNFCSAYTPYDGNPDYIYIGTYGSGGFAYYLYVPSIDVQEYNPPHYQIEGKFLSVFHHGEGSANSYYETIRYNWYMKETFKLNDRGYWEKENTDGEIGRYNRKRANALFRAAYGMNFYN